MNEKRKSVRADSDAKTDAASSGHNAQIIVQDEVCGMTFPDKDAAAVTQFQDRTYHFCSERCRVRFEEHPGWYVPLKP